MIGDVFNYGETWLDIPHFSRYQISSEGRVFNKVSGVYMKTSQNNFGHPKISLLDEDGKRYTRSPAVLVAKAFVKPPNNICDRVVYLNGEHDDIRSENLVWRPRWFAWKYARQLKQVQPVHYHNLKVKNILNGNVYTNVIEAGMMEGLLYEHIWHSTYTGRPVFPDGSIWAVDERV